MSEFLFDTLVWTAVLIALVLVLRRPVARHLGPQAAYALWALPALRLLLPPIELPAWLAPAPAQETTLAPVSTAAPIAQPETVFLVVPAAEPSMNWASWFVGAWLLGAVIFLVWRFSLYFRMRNDLLAEAKPVGETGRIRLVETPAAPSPIAFGLIDRVIALPPGFMAWQDRPARDLVLAHEIAHHEGRDLLANFAVQPLFALHWFNPLGWLGWRAMRRDQEAACDARVLASRERQERATYAEIIASYAAGPNVTLAAPMACPVLGEKSIIHRLRSITMSDLSPRRRHLGRALVVAGALALPLTASITYAEIAPAAPTPPAPPPPVAAPAAPPAPVAPPAPPAPLSLQASASVEAPEDDDDGHRVVMVSRTVDEDEDGEGKRKVTKKVDRRIVTSHGRKLTEEERARILEEVEEGLAEMDDALEEAREARKTAMIELRNAQGRMTQVSVECNGDRERRIHRDDDDRSVVMVCTSDIMADALSGLKEAREAIAKSREMDREIRETVLRALDQRIANWKDQN